MPGSSFGHILSLHTFGESHGEAIGGILQGMPSGIELDLEAIQKQLDRRRPGQSKLVTQRQEKDQVQILSGIFKGKTTGTPIGFTIQNTDQKPKDYEHIAEQYRPSHADYTYDAKYGNRDYRGGGRSSARETACRVVAGAMAMQVLKKIGIQICAYVSAVGKIALDNDHTDLDLNLVDETPVRCPDPQKAQEMEAHILSIKKEGDTVGGKISCVIKGVSPGLGAPIFDKLHADLGKAMLSINAVKGFEYGTGFKGSEMKGSEHNDEFFIDDGKISTKTNRSGGIQGGISNGQDIYFTVAFKPVATLMRDQKSLDMYGRATTIKGKGRHDPCVVPRAVPIVDAMAALVILDHYLLNQTVHIND